MVTLGRRSAMLACAALLTTAVAGCTDRQSTASVGAQPVAATAYPSPSPGGGQVAISPSQDIQSVSIRIVDGRFAADVYDVQSRPARLEVWATGGSYTLAVDGLMAPQPLDQNNPTVIGLTLPDPGRYTMRLGGESTATATLNVRPPGER